MTVFQSILLGVIQGITEFLPVSSSGHLVIVPYLLSWNIPAQDAFIFDVLVQLATLIAVFAYFWRDLSDIVRMMLSDLRSKHPFHTDQSKLGWYILLATIPAGVIGILLKDAVERAFNNPIMTAIFLLITALMLLIAEFVGKRERSLSDMMWKDALWIGLFQAFAIFPGISRSGATITGGMTRNLERPTSARFSFLLSIPIMLAAGIAASIDLSQLPQTSGHLFVYIPGFISAAITGYLAIRWLLGYLSGHPLYIFSIYCAVLGGLTLLYGLIR